MRRQKERGRGRSNTLPMKRQLVPNVRVAAAVTIALALALLLRVWGLRWGLPNEQHYHSYHPDEFAVISSAVQIDPLGQGIEGLNPHFYNYGTLYIFMAAAAKSIGVGYGWIRADAQGPQLYVEFGKIHLAARLVNVLFGAAMAYVVYALGRRLYGVGAGVLAAFLVAIAPILTAHAHYATVDTTAAFWTTLSLVFAARALDSCRARDFVWAGVFAGFAGGTKYNAGLVLIAVGVAVASAALRLKRHRWKRFWQWWPLVTAAAAVSFIVATPGVLIAFPEFWNAIRFERWHALVGHGQVFSGTAPGWWYHIVPNMPFALGVPLAVLVLSALAAAIIRRGRGDWLLLAWIVPYYLVIGASEVKFMRYLIPIIPTMLVLAAKLAHDLAMRSRGRLSMAGCVLVGFVILWTGYDTARYDAVFARPDPRDEAAAWIARHAAGETVGMVAAPWFQSVPVVPWNGGQITQGQFASDPNRGRVETTGWDVRLLDRERPDVYTLSEFEYRDGLRTHDPQTTAFLNALKQTYRHLEEFGAGELPIPFPFTRDRVPHDYMYPAPITQVYHNSRPHAAITPSVLGRRGRAGEPLRGWGIAISNRNGASAVAAATSTVAADQAGGTSDMLGTTSLSSLPILRKFKSRRVSSYDRTGGNGDCFPIAAHASGVIADIEGPGCIKHIWMGTRTPDPYHLRKILIRMYWDDEKEPSVDCPRGDFFGVGHAAATTYFSQPLSMVQADRPDQPATNCYFPMPFRKRARIEIVNDTDEEFLLWYYVDYEAYDELPGDVACFHAQWRRENPCEKKPERLNVTGDDNYVVLDAEGRGIYVGCVLSVHALERGWWGEGDDMIFIDGEKWPPSLHGTGTEDYFCSGYEFPEAQPWYGPYHGVSLAGGGGSQNMWNTLAGKTNRWSVYRFHIEDPVAFEKSIRVTIEHGHSNNRGDDWSSVAYWYQMEPHKPFPPMPGVEERLPRTSP
jgi:hypothetical protein